ncbi:uncharacterized protein isoform X2 [Leptinotarsa decemlineata]|uniref:uncharacterized protein isoform X2 n=1 Tax=Leptinotarsa decemlineata TaxID=7539 RepID=UPI000C2526DE|nr:uncharacterized protein LOC111506303 isoform X2 [Leptinotarsa decemlineata]
MDTEEFERSQIKLEIVCNDYTGASETDEFLRFSSRGQNDIDVSSTPRLHHREQTNGKSMFNLENLYDRDMKPIKEEKEDVSFNLLNLKMENIEVENSLVKSDFCIVCNGKFNDEIDVTGDIDGYQCFCQEYQESKPDYINHEDILKECGLKEADCCAFGRFGRGSPVVLHSDEDCFDSRVK